MVAKFLSSEAGAEWELVAPKRLTSWARRGVVGTSGLRELDAQKLIRCSPDDQTNGFFVALFQRKAEFVAAFPSKKRRLEHPEPEHTAPAAADQDDCKPPKGSDGMANNPKGKSKAASSSRGSQFFKSGLISKNKKRKFGKR